MTKFTRYQLRFQWHFDLPVYFSIAVIVSFCLAEDSFRQYLPGHLSRYQDRLGETKLTMRIPLPRLRKKANKELYCQHQNFIKYSWPSYDCPIDTKISLLIHNRRIQPTSYPTPSRDFWQYRRGERHFTSDVSSPGTLNDGSTGL